MNYNQDEPTQCITKKVKNKYRSSIKLGKFPNPNVYSGHSKINNKIPYYQNSRQEKRKRKKKNFPKTIHIHTFHICILSYTYVYRVYTYVYAL